MSTRKPNPERVKEINDLLYKMCNGDERQGEEDFFEALRVLHPTLQQAWWRIQKQIMYRYAELPPAHFDRRNQASLEFVKDCIESKARFVGLPVI